MFFGRVASKWLSKTSTVGLQTEVLNNIIKKKDDLKEIDCKSSSFFGSQICICLSVWVGGIAGR